MTTWTVAECSSSTDSSQLLLLLDFYHSLRAFCSLTSAAAAVQYRALLLLAISLSVSLHSRPVLCPIHLLSPTHSPPFTKKLLQAMASQTQGIQQLLIAEKKAAEKVCCTFCCRVLLLFICRYSLSHFTRNTGPRGPQEEGPPIEAGQG